VVLDLSVCDYVVIRRRRGALAASLSPSAYRPLTRQTDRQLERRESQISQAERRSDGNGPFYRFHRFSLCPRPPRRWPSLHHITIAALVRYTQPNCQERPQDFD